MNKAQRRAQHLLRWYPRSWRDTHANEFAALLEDSMLDRPFWPRRSLNIAFNGFQLRSKEIRASHHRVVFSSGASILALVVVIGVFTNVYGLLSNSGPTKGGMPYCPGTGNCDEYNKLPDFLSVVIGPGVIGYTPKAYAAARNGSTNDPLLGQAQPIYASNLTTLVGHEYPGIGYVPLGDSPWAQPCHAEYVSNGTTTSTIPCQSTTLVLPNVVGMVTPTAVGQLSSLGINVVIQNVHSKKIPVGHIVSTSPVGGAVVHARQPVIVYISVSN